MLYKINNNYYILVGNKYVEIDFSIKKDITIIPNPNKYIEKSNNIIVVEQPFTDEFKKQLRTNHDKEFDKQKEKSNNTNKNRYKR